MSGLAPLSFQTIQAWSHLTGHSPAPWEVRALLRVDAALRGAASTTNTDGQERAPDPPWPEKRGG